MKVIILGAGEVGKGLAATLCLEKNDVIMVDKDEKLLEDLSETLLCRQVSTDHLP